MDVDAVTQYCLTLPGSEERLSGPPGNRRVFHVGDRQFAYFKTSEPEQWRFSIRVIPERFLELTDQPGIKPARYMHRFHWVTIVSVNSMADGHLTDLIRGSYDMAFSRLPRTQQQKIAG